MPKILHAISAESSHRDSTARRHHETPCVFHCTRGNLSGRLFACRIVFPSMMTLENILALIISEFCRCISRGAIHHVFAYLFIRTPHTVRLRYAASGSPKARGRPRCTAATLLDVAFSQCHLRKLLTPMDAYMPHSSMLQHTDNAVRESPGGVSRGYSQ